MKATLCAALCAASGLVWAETGSADPGKDENGKGRQHGAYADTGHRYEDYLRARDAYERQHGRKHAKAVDLPAGHLPPPGECRDWYPDLPAGHQPPPYRC
jgi:hypothetical protein